MALIKVLFAVCASLIFGGVHSADRFDVYGIIGENAVLRCNRLANRGPRCSAVEWNHIDKHKSNSRRVHDGKLTENSGSLTFNKEDCSLTIHNITAADAGYFLCSLSIQSGHETFVYLNILTVSQTERKTSNSEGNITLQCSLETYTADVCHDGAFQWFNENKMFLHEDKGSCGSSLTVERESKHRTFFCHFVKRNQVQASVKYSLKESVHPKNPAPDSSGSDEDFNRNMFIIIGAVVSLLLLLVAAVVLFKIKSKHNTPKTTVAAPDDPPTQQPMDPVDDLESAVTYASVNYHNKSNQTTKRELEVEESVTYSAVSIKTTVDDSAIYSTVNKTKQNSHGRSIT